MARKKFYEIDTEVHSTMYRDCPICWYDNKDEDCYEEDFENLICYHCQAKFEYDWEADGKDIYRYVLVDEFGNL